MRCVDCGLTLHNQVAAFHYTTSRSLWQTQANTGDAKMHTDKVTVW